MTTQQPQIEVPANWEGSLPEYVAYQTFVELGLEPGQDFTYPVSYTHLTLPTNREV